MASNTPQLEQFFFQDRLKTELYRGILIDGWRNIPISLIVRLARFHLGLVETVRVHQLSSVILRRGTYCSGSDSTPPLRPRTAFSPVAFSRRYPNRLSLFGWETGLRKLAVCFHDRWPRHTSLTDSTRLFG